MAQKIKAFDSADFFFFVLIAIVQQNSATRLVPILRLAVKT